MKLLLNSLDDLAVPAVSRRVDIIMEAVGAEAVNAGGLKLACTTQMSRGAIRLVDNDYEVTADLCKTCSRCEYWRTANPCHPGHNKRGELMEA